MPYWKVDKPNRAISEIDMVDRYYLCVCLSNEFKSMWVFPHTKTLLFDSGRIYPCLDQKTEAE